MFCYEYDMFSLEKAYFWHFSIF